MKKDIVISNHFTTKRSDGSATRGATPGQFVTRYMSRDEKGATEPLAPFTLDSEGSRGGVLRYNARELEVVDIKDEGIVNDGRDIKRRFKRLDGLGGRAFSHDNLSLSDRELKTESNRIQDAFDNGHAVQLMVISFSEKFLREHGVLDDDFVFKGDGSYKNNYDQMKMRMAITRGVNDMTEVGRYKAPAWVATLQVDTAHLHCHLAVCDTEFSEDRVRSDGDDRGKIRDFEKDAIRHGISRELDLMRGYSFYHKGNQKDKESVLAMVKDVDFHEASYTKELQLIMGSLPKDDSLWKSNSDDVSMRYPNELARGFVARIYTDYGEQCGYNQARERIVALSLTEEDSEMFVRNGVDALINRGVDGIYNQLKNVSEEDVSVKTDLLRVRSLDDDELKQAVLERGVRQEEFDPFGFELRTRAYQKRIRNHVRDVRRYGTALNEYFEQERSSDAERMRDYYKAELKFHSEVVDKYRTFFSWGAGSTKDFDGEYERVSEDFQVLKRRRELESLTSDDIAKRYGYSSRSDAQGRVSELNARGAVRDGVPDVGLLLSSVGRHRFVDETEKQEQSFEILNRDYALNAYVGGQLSSRELISVMDDAMSEPYRNRNASALYSKEDFERVKANDLHDMDVDYYGVSKQGFAKKSVDSFTDVYNSRLNAYLDAREYLDETGQTSGLLGRTEVDLYKMRTVAERLNEGTFEMPELDVSFVEKKEKLDKTMTLDTKIDVIHSLHDVLEL